MFKRDQKPTVIITGASGFVGKYLVDFLKDEYHIIGIARRSRTESGITYHPNLDWVQWDVANDKLFNQVLGYIIGKGRADYLIHLAGYYNFDYSDNDEYERTNVHGTKNILELARKINVRHFIFASSLAALKFVGSNGLPLSEKEKLIEDFAYAKSKKAGEEMCLEYSRHFKCSVVRFAAVFSDWCEYAPLYKFLETWLSKRWESRILAGKGQSAVSYIHINDLSKLLKSIISHSARLKDFEVFHASPNGCTSHLDLFLISTRDYFGSSLKPVFLPKFLAYPGIVAKNILGKLGLMPVAFERPWMVKYIDEKLNIDSTYTQMTLNWQPAPRLSVERRLLYLQINMKSHHQEWIMKNEELIRRVTMRPNLKIYEYLLQLQDNILDKLIKRVMTDQEATIFENFRRMDWREFNSHISQLYFLIMASVRSSDRSIMIKYIEDLALAHFAAGFTSEEVTSLLYLFNNIIIDELTAIKELSGFRQEIYDNIGLSIQLAIDETENIYENLEEKLSPEKLASLKSLKQREIRKAFIEKLSTFYHDTEENQTENQSEPPTIL